MQHSSCGGVVWLMIWLLQCDKCMFIAIAVDQVPKDTYVTIEMYVSDTQ